MGAPGKGMAINWTDEQLEFINALRKQNEEWRSIAKQVNQKFGLNTTADAVNHAHIRWSDIGFFDNDQTTVRKARQARLAQRHSAFNARTLRHVGQHGVNGVAHQGQPRTRHLPGMGQRRTLHHGPLTPAIASLAGDL